MKSSSVSTMARLDTSSEGVGSGHGMDPLHSLPPPVERSAGGCGGGEDGVADGSAALPT